MLMTVSCYLNVATLQFLSSKHLTSLALAGSIDIFNLSFTGLAGLRVIDEFYHYLFSRLK